MRRPVLLFLLLALLPLVLLSGCCGGTPYPFSLYDDTTVIRPSTVAVISTDPSEPTMRLADNLTRELKERSTFKVISQEEVRRRVGKYPVTIKMGQAENEDKPVYFARGEKAKVDAMQAQIKAEYLFVIWSGNMSRITRTGQGGSSVNYSIDVYGNVVEYPKGRIIGFTSFARNQGQSCCLTGKSEGDDINEMLKGVAESMADKFIAAARAEKPAK